MFKIILISILTITMVFAMGMDITQATSSVQQKIFKIDKINFNKVCGYYRSESERYFLKGNQSLNQTVAWRYLNIANKYADQYVQCVVDNNQHKVYQGYRTNQFK